MLKVNIKVNMLDDIFVKHLRRFPLSIPDISYFAISWFVTHHFSKKCMIFGLYNCCFYKGMTKTMKYFFAFRRIFNTNLFSVPAEPFRNLMTVTIHIRTLQVIKDFLMSCIFNG